jgi:hypothetical protein
VPVGITSNALEALRSAVVICVLSVICFPLRSV